MAYLKQLKNPLFLTLFLENLKSTILEDTEEFYNNFCDETYFKNILEITNDNIDTLHGQRSKLHKNDVSNWDYKTTNIEIEFSSKYRNKDLTDKVVKRIFKKYGDIDYIGQNFCENKDNIVVAFMTYKAAAKAVEELNGKIIPEISSRKLSIFIV